MLPESSITVHAATQQIVYTVGLNVHTLLLHCKRLTPKTTCSHLSCSYIQVVAHPLYLSLLNHLPTQDYYRLQHYWMNTGNIHTLCLKMDGSLDYIHDYQINAGNTVLG